MLLCASPHLVETLFRFRVGAAGLRCGLHVENQEDRYCPVCDLGKEEDQRHVLVECPAYDHIRARDQFHTLFCSYELLGTIKDLLNVHQQHTLASFLSQVIWERTRLLQQQQAPVSAPSDVP